MSYGSNGWDPWDEPDRTEMRIPGRSTRKSDA